MAYTISGARYVIVEIVLKSVICMFCILTLDLRLSIAFDQIVLVGWSSNILFRMIDHTLLLLSNKLYENML